jgi:hypothetical protein
MMRRRFHKTGRSALIAVLLCCWIGAAQDSFAARDAAKEMDAAGRKNDIPAPSSAEAITDELFSDAGAALPVYLYFADSDARFLRGEQRSGLRFEPGADDPAECCRRLMDALAAGPQSGLSRTLPQDAKVRAVFVEGKTAYVDFSREVSVSHPGGILSELMTLYSVVNTLVLNVDAVDKVKLLIAGQDAETLAGHVDIRFPLNADIILIK